MSSRVLRVISYNILDGFTTHPHRRERVADWLAGRRADVVALCELNQYTEDRLRRVPPLGLTCRATEARRLPHGPDRAPITDVQHHRRLSSWRTARPQAGILVIHLSPHGFACAPGQASRIMVVKNDNGVVVIVLGDFNSCRLRTARCEACARLSPRPRASHRPNLNDGQLHVPDAARCGPDGRVAQRPRAGIRLRTARSARGRRRDGVAVSGIDSVGDTELATHPHPACSTTPRWTPLGSLPDRSRLRLAGRRALV